MSITPAALAPAITGTNEVGRVVEVREGTGYGRSFFGILSVKAVRFSVEKALSGRCEVVFGERTKN